jgi:hypothetical protein
MGYKSGGISDGHVFVGLRPSAGYFFFIVFVNTEYIPKNILTKIIHPPTENPKSILATSPSVNINIKISALVC